VSANSAEFCDKLGEFVLAMTAKTESDPDTSGFLLLAIFAFPLFTWSHSYISNAYS